MRKTTLILVLSTLSLIVVAGVSASCNKDQDLTPNGTTSKTTDTAKMPEQGAGGVKAEHGGGMAPMPKPAAPGEKTGIPK
jgi:hypothetical protein